MCVVCWSVLIPIRLFPVRFFLPESMFFRFCFPLSWSFHYWHSVSLDLGFLVVFSWIEVLFLPGVSDGSERICFQTTTQETQARMKRTKKWENAIARRYERWPVEGKGCDCVKVRKTILEMNKWEVKVLRRLHRIQSRYVSDCAVSNKCRSMRQRQCSRINMIKQSWSSLKWILKVKCCWP